MKKIKMAIILVVLLGGLTGCRLYKKADVAVNITSEDNIILTFNKENYVVTKEEVPLENNSIRLVDVLRFKKTILNENTYVTFINLYYYADNIAVGINEKFYKIDKEKNNNQVLKFTKIKYEGEQ